jgi:thiamine transport system ATP-binding protein
LLEAVDLTLDYPDFHAEYTLVVPAGALCGLIGPSGGGKTTLLHAIAGFETPSRGVLRFAGHDLLGLAPAERPLSILFQEHNLFPHLTAASNVGLGIDPRLRLDAEGHTAVGRALARVGLAGFEHRRPAELSGGQRQRVALARALVRKRPLMLLDEPFGGLDPGLRREMLALVDAVRREQELTVLLSIHTPEDLASTADLIAFVAEGRVVAAGRPDQLLSPGRTAAIDRYLGRDGLAGGNAGEVAAKPL